MSSLVCAGATTHLSDAILERIFYFISLRPDTVAYTDRTWYHFSHVCRRWRKVALASRRLWSRIYICRHTEIDMFRQFLLRSARVPIVVGIKADPNIDLELDSVAHRIAGLLSPHFRRIVSFELIEYGQCYIPAVFKTLTTPAPNIQRLHIRSSMNNGNGAYTENIFGLHTPLLRIVTLDCELPFSAPIVSNLTELTVGWGEKPDDDETLGTLIRMLRRSPRLRKLELIFDAPFFHAKDKDSSSSSSSDEDKDEDSPQDEGEESAEDSSEENSDGERPLLIASLDFLQQLTLRMDFVDTARLLPHLSFPLTTSVYLKFAPPVRFPDRTPFSISDKALSMRQLSPIMRDLRLEFLSHRIENIFVDIVFSAYDNAASPQSLIQLCWDYRRFIRFDSPYVESRFPVIIDLQYDHHLIDLSYIDFSVLDFRNVERLEVSFLELSIAYEQWLEILSRLPNLKSISVDNDPDPTLPLTSNCSLFFALQSPPLSETNSTADIVCPHLSSLHFQGLLYNSLHYADRIVQEEIAQLLGECLKYRTDHGAPLSLKLEYLEETETSMDVVDMLKARLEADGLVPNAVTVEKVWRKQDYYESDLESWKGKWKMTP